MNKPTEPFRFDATGAISMAEAEAKTTASLLATAAATDDPVKKQIALATAKISPLWLGVLSKTIFETKNVGDACDVFGTVLGRLIIASIINLKANAADADVDVLALAIMMRVESVVHQNLARFARGEMTYEKVIISKEGAR